MSGNFFVPGYTNVPQRVLDIILKNRNFSKFQKSENGDNSNSEKILIALMPHI